MNAEGILKRKGRNVSTIEPAATVASAAMIMRRDRVGALVISDNGWRLLGLLTEGDIVSGLAKFGARLLDMRVSELMGEDVYACKPEDSIATLMAEMTNRRTRHLPVVVDGSLCGLVSIGDVVRNHLAEVELETNVLRDAYLVERERRA